MLVSPDQVAIRLQSRQLAGTRTGGDDDVADVDRFGDMVDEVDSYQLLA